MPNSKIGDIFTPSGSRNKRSGVLVPPDSPENIEVSNMGGCKGRRHNPSTAYGRLKQFTRE